MQRSTQSSTKVPVILLTGPKHSGKTSAGRVLARLISGSFIDLDGLIEERTGKSPRALYREGPEVFRNAEAEALEYLLRLPPLLRVAAAGGGLIDNEGAMALLAAPGRVFQVFLELSVETAWERIERAGALPPFLAGDDPRGVHRALHIRRAGAYRKAAALVIEAEGKTAEEIAQAIQRAWGARGSLGPPAGAAPPYRAPTG